MNSYLYVDETGYKLMRLLEAQPGISQRDAACALGVSLGKANYCFKALIQKGWVKFGRFTSSKDRSAYVYLLTPTGIEQKAALAVQFLRAKTLEYKALRKEIEQIRREASRHGDSK